MSHEIVIFAPVFDLQNGLYGFHLQLPRRWFRFRLRSLLLSVTAIAILLGWIARERRISDQELQRAQSFLDRGVLGVTVGGPYDSFD